MQKTDVQKPSNRYDTAYNILLEDFNQYCGKVIHEHVHDEQKGEDVNNTILNTQYNPNICTIKNNWAREAGKLCSQLSKWIYIPSNPLPEPSTYAHNNLKPKWIYKRIVFCKSTQIIQWALLQHTKLPQYTYLVFKGSSPHLIFDTIMDTGCIPNPIFCNENNKSYWDFAVHAGIHSALMRDFYNIWNIINTELHSFSTLIITGHSLGGSISILFALESIIKNKCLPSNKQMIVMSFGNPIVISYEKPFNQLSIQSQHILSKLHNICHCFVNKFDPIARLPTKSEWMITVIPYAIRRVIKHKLSTMWSTLINYGAKSAHIKFVKNAIRYMDILQSYHPFGTYYFCGMQNNNKPFITKNQKIIEQILGYIPPHKIIDSVGNSILVGHFSMRMGYNRFGLKHLRNINTLMDEMDINDNDIEIESTKTIDANKLINSISKGNNCNDECIYILLKSDDENIIKQTENRKLNGKDWLQLVNNHICEEYVTLFDSIQIEALSLNHSEHAENVSMIKQLNKQNNEPRKVNPIKQTISKLISKFGKLRQQ